ncbi:MAG TPA: hypothetical protein VFL83_11475 [Anaeromyxobacter sp.]|nr:hypothetical protein [Anaeromyxobacter sp.]
MTPLAVLLALAVAAGPSGAPRRTGIETSNAARAKAGLLPRKPARARPEGRRRPVVHAPAPTFLAEPAPLAQEEDPPAEASGETAEERVAAPLAGRSAERLGDRLAAPLEDRPEEPLLDRAEEPLAARSDEPLVAARGPIVTTVASAIEPIAAAAPGGEPEPTAIVAMPEEIGTVRAAAMGVATEVILRLRFEP